MEQSPLKKKKDHVLWSSIFISGTLVSIGFFRWTLIDWLTGFLEPFLEMVVGIAFLCVFVWSLRYFVSEHKTFGLRAGSALLINTTALLVFLFVPFSPITIKLDFDLNYASRMKVVDDVLQGKMEKYVMLRGDSTGNVIHLPKPYQSLSAGGGDIAVHRRDGQTLILFFSFRGILRSFSGFVYTTGNSSPQNGDFGENFVEIESLRPNWYWVASRN
jgi:hypothetical protein